MPGSHTRVRPARHTNYSHELQVNVRGVHGHEGYCSCGWEGIVWRTPGQAQAEARWHWWEEHSKEYAARRREDASATRGAEKF